MPALLPARSGHCLPALLRLAYIQSNRISRLCRASNPISRLQVLLLPEDKNAVLICVATGTGIAPYRSFWRRIFYENVPNYKFSGLFWLFMGAANSDACLYDNEIQVRLAATPARKRYRLSPGRCRGCS